MSSSFDKLFSLDSGSESFSGTTTEVTRDTLMDPIIGVGADPSELLDIPYGIAIPLHLESITNPGNFVPL